VVKQSHLIVLFFLLGTVVSVSAVPPVDNPATVFNELDAPVNLAPTALPRIKLAPPAADSTALPKLPICWLAWVVSDSRRALPPITKLNHRHSVQKLFCTFLI
jgi:hypothetical protein